MDPMDSTSPSLRYWNDPIDFTPIASTSKRIGPQIDPSEIKLDDGPSIYPKRRLPKIEIEKKVEVEVVEMQVEVEEDENRVEQTNQVREFLPLEEDSIVQDVDNALSMETQFDEKQEQKKEKRKKSRATQEQLPVAEMEFIESEVVVGLEGTKEADDTLSMEVQLKKKEKKEKREKRKAMEMQSPTIGVEVIDIGVAELEEAKKVESEADRDARIEAMSINELKALESRLTKKIGQIRQELKVVQRAKTKTSGGPHRAPLEILGSTDLLDFKPSTNEQRERVKSYQWKSQDGQRLEAILLKLPSLDFNIQLDWNWLAQKMNEDSKSNVPITSEVLEKYGKRVIKRLRTNTNMSTEHPNTSRYKNTNEGVRDNSVSKSTTPTPQNFTKQSLSPSKTPTQRGSSKNNKTSPRSQWNNRSSTFSPPPHFNDKETAAFQRRADKKKKRAEIEAPKASLFDKMKALVWG